MAKKIIKATVLTLFFFLLQTCFMQHVKLGGVAANVLAINIAILTVSYGRRSAFCASCATGILLEATTFSVGGLYAVIYPAIGTAFSFIWADMNEEKRERRLLNAKAEQKVKEDLNAHLRIPLNAMCIALALEGIYLVYMMVSSTDFSFVLAGRAVLTVLYTGLLAGILMFPARLFLGMYHHPIHRAMVEEKNEDHP